MSENTKTVKSLTVFAYNVPEILREISKKGTVSDIAMHNRKDGDVIITFIEPHLYPDKVSSLTDSIYPSDISIIDGTKLTKELGEVIVALDLMNKGNGFFVYTDESQITTLKQIVKGTSLENYQFFNGTPMELVELLKTQSTEKGDGKTLVVVDHFFKVKSVGTVILGFVVRGKVGKHQKLQLSGLDREIQVRSIQMHDEEQAEAGPGSRVGLAVKNVDSDELERGMFLSEEPFEYVTEIDSKIEIHNAVKKIPEGDFEVFASDLMRYQRGAYTNGKVVLDKKIVKVGSQLVLSNPNIFPRIFAKVTIE